MSSTLPGDAVGSSPASKRASAVLPPPPVTTTIARVLIKVRDYGFDEDNRWFEGRGDQVPRQNRINVLARRLMTTQTFTVNDSGKSSLGAERDKREKRRAKGQEMNVKLPRSLGGRCRLMKAGEERKGRARVKKGLEVR